MENCKSVTQKYVQIFKPEQTTTCLQRPPFLGFIFTFYKIKLPQNNDHLSTTTTNIGSPGWSLYQVWLYFQLFHTNIAKPIIINFGHKCRQFLIYSLGTNSKFIEILAKQWHQYLLDSNGGNSLKGGLKCDYRNYFASVQKCSLNGTFKQTKTTDDMQCVIAIT